VRVAGVERIIARAPSSCFLAFETEIGGNAGLFRFAWRTLIYRNLLVDGRLGYNDGEPVDEI
jgi:hypothetical protein